jgi:hypothetical protein
MVATNRRGSAGEGFDKSVNAVSAIEKRLGGYDLAQFTLRV